MKPLIAFTTKSFLLAFVFAGVLFFTWHLGRLFEKQNDRDITFAGCSPTADPETLDCVLYEVEPEIANIFKAIIDELNNPTTKEELEKHYSDWEEKVGL